MTGSEMVVKELESSDFIRWDQFVNSCRDGTFFHLSGWKTLIENRLDHQGHYLYCESAGEITAVLPLVRVKSWLFGDALISAPFLVYGGPIGTNEQARQLLAAEARNLAESIGVDYLELRNREPLDGSWHGKTTYVTFRKAIDGDPEKNLKSVPRKQRAMIRKGMKAGLVAEEDASADRLYTAMLECKRNLGTPFFGAGWLQAIKDEFADNVEIMTITHQRKIVCSVMSFRYQNEILPYYGGGGDLARKLKGNDFMYWAVMEKACQQGVTLFDYGRSSVDSGSFRFKKHWGFEPTPLAYQYYLVKSEVVPQLNPSNPRYRLAIDTWRKLPLSIASIAGPPIAKRLG
jgi:FemAB-related protein (PEP-CTERM system-associated)